MLPSTGYFKTINCPFYDSGLCERPYCHFRHAKEEELQASTSQLAAANEKGGNEAALQQLVSEAVRKVLLERKVLPEKSDGSEIVSKVIQTISQPETSKQVPSYKPTPIAQLRRLQSGATKRRSPLEYKPSKKTREGKSKYSPSHPNSESVAGYSPNYGEKGSVSYTPSNITDIDLKGSQYVPSGSDIKDGGVDYKPTSKDLTNHSQAEYLPITGSSSASNLYVPTDISKLGNVLTIENDILEKDEDSDPGNDFDLFEQVLSEGPKSEAGVVKKTNHTVIYAQNEQGSLKRYSDLASGKYVPKKPSESIKSVTSAGCESRNEKKPSEPSASNFDKTNADKDAAIKNDSETKRLKEPCSKPANEERASKTLRLNKESDNKASNECKKAVKSKDEHKSSKEKVRDSHNNSEVKRDKDEHKLRKEKELTRSRDSDKKNESKEHKVKESSSRSSKEKSSSSSRHKSSKSHSSSHKESKSKDHKSSSKDRKNGDRERKKDDKDRKDDRKRREHKSNSHSNHKHKSKKSDDDNKKGTTSAHETTKGKKEPSPILVDIFAVGSNVGFDEPPDSPEMDSYSFMSELEDNSDPDDDEVTRECYRIFQEYKPDKNKQDNHSQKKVQQLESKAQVEDPKPVSGKQRVAHNAAHDFVPKIPRPPKAVPKPSASQVMVDRWKKVQEICQQPEAAPVPVVAAIPVDVRPTPGSSLLRSGVVSFTQGKKRIAHVPNVTSLLMAKTQVKPTETKPDASTIAQTVSKGGKRVAHIPTQEVLQRPTISAEFGSKVPANVRQRYLNSFVDECLKLCPTQQEAFDRAIQEELNCYTRCTTRTVYLNVAVNNINRLRKEVECASTSPLKAIEEAVAAGSSSGPNRTVSHMSILAGKGGARNSWSIERATRRSMPDQISDAEMYRLLSRYILTPEQLRDNGFPRPDPSEKGRALILSTEVCQKTTHLANPFKRICGRCQTMYAVNKQGVQLSEEPCTHHWGRQYKRRGATGWEGKYSCCQGDSHSGGCCVAKCHVSDNFDPDNLRGFVKTLPRSEEEAAFELPGVYALDCEMCYTTMGNELTRITVIGTDMKPIFETLVRPENPIIDYNTRFSGITEEDMQGVKTTLRDVQAVLLSRFSDKSILIGHSLESDFKALKLIHDTVVDTSVVFPHKMGPPFKRALRTLCADYIKKIIQSDVGGHDSAEDARACMELMVWRLKEDLKGR